MLTRMTSSEAIVVEEGSQATHRAAMRWLGKPDDQVITYADAFSFALMQSTRCEVAISFDRDFVVAGFRVWTAAVRG